MLWRLMIILAALVLLSCAQHKQKGLPVANATPPNSTDMEEAPNLAVMEVVILVSEDIPDYSKVAKALAKQLGQRGSIRYLDGSQVENSKILAAYKKDEHKQFVSIGLNASVAAKTLTNRPVVFCQVFNYQDYELLSAGQKGVSMMPSMSKTFSTWRVLAPNINDIGVISGPGFEGMIKTATAAAKKNGITLHHETVNSDKEYQYAYKQMADMVQGYWLLPDNRVLSENILRDVMTFSMRNSKQVAVFSEELLSLGGLFSTTSDHQDIAQQVLIRLEQTQNKDKIPGPDIVYLDQSIIRINPVMAQRLNLVIPEQYKKYEYAP